MIKQVALSDYINSCGDEYLLSKTYIKQAEKQIKELIKNSKPVDKDIQSFNRNINSDTGLTHHNKIAVGVYLNKKKLGTNEN